MSIKRLTQFTVVFAIVALIVGLSACDQIGQLLVPGSSEMEDPSIEHVVSVEIPIGVVLAQTGDFANAYGLPMLDGFELAREHINNSGLLGDAKLKFIVKDDQSVSAVDAVNELIAAKASVITGFAISTQLEQVIQTADDNEVVLFSSVSSRAGLSALSDFLFRAGLTSAVLNPPLVEKTHMEFGYQKAARIYQENDIYAEGSDEEFRKALVDRGVEVLEPEIYQKGDADFSDQLNRIMASNADALFISALGDRIPLIMKQARDLMPSVHIIVPELTNIEVEGAGEAAEGVVTAIGWRVTDDPRNQAFVQSYTEAYGEAPVAWAAQSYATLHILAAAIAEAYATTHSIDATAIRDALANTMDVPTILGNFSFNADGDAVYPPNLLVVENGDFVVFE